MNVMKLYFFALIIILGIITTVTDLRYRKIKNTHLAVIAIIAVLSYGFFITAQQLIWSLELLLNPLVALALGFALYIARLWEAGDAKLFIVYCLLLPASQPFPLLPLPSLAMFVVTFILSSLLLMPVSVYGIIRNKNKFIKEVMSKKTPRYFVNIFLIAFSLSWIIQPILALSPLKNNIFIDSIIIFGGYLLLFQFVARIRKPALLMLIFTAGIVLRYRFMPYFFSFNNIAFYAGRILLYSIIFYFLNTIIAHKQEAPVRIPFSPFMFLGALLTNADIVWWVAGFFYSH